MSRYYRNWQYGVTKEVLAVHEVIEPYDWKLDLEMNEDWQLWGNQLTFITKKEEEYEWARKARNW